MDRSLQDDVVLVAGGAGEVGEGITRQFLHAGAIVVVPSRSPEKLDALQFRLGGLAEQLVVLHGDIGTPGGAAAICDLLVDEVGPLHHVVASLGRWWQGSPLTTVPLDLWQRLLDASLTAHFITARTFLPLLADSRGSYTLINGAGALQPVSLAGPVSISAAAQLMLGQVLAAENRDAGVRVNSLVLATSIATRSRRAPRPEWLTADDVGAYCVHLAGSEREGEMVVLEDRNQLPR